MAYRKRSRSSMMRRRRAPRRMNRMTAYRKKRNYRLRRGNNRIVARLPTGQALKSFVGLTCGQCALNNLQGATPLQLSWATGKSPFLNALARECQGWDQWKAFYQRYRVRAMKVRVTITPVNANTSFIGYMYTYNQSTPVGNVLAQASDKGTITRVCGPQTSKLTFMKYWKAGSPWGETPEQWRTDITTEAATAANPTTMSYCHLDLRNNTTTDAPLIIDWKVKVYFELFMPVYMVDA